MTTAPSVIAEGTAPRAGGGGDARRPTEERVALAIDLGWRMAELFAVNVDYEPSERTCQLLPSRNSLSRHDRLELELLAAAGAAARLGVHVPDERLHGLRALAARAAKRGGGETEFRNQLEQCHIELDKQLWTHSEADGRAYELGIMLSDTYNRICRVYHENPERAREEWLEVFGEQRSTVTSSSKRPKRPCSAAATARGSGFRSSG